MGVVVKMRYLLCVSLFLASFNLKAAVPEPLSPQQLYDRHIALKNWISGSSHHGSHSGYRVFMSNQYGQAHAPFKFTKVLTTDSSFAQAISGSQSKSVLKDMFTGKALYEVSASEYDKKMQINARYHTTGIVLFVTDPIAQMNGNRLWIRFAPHEVTGTRTRISWHMASCPVATATEWIASSDYYIGSQSPYGTKLDTSSKQNVLTQAPWLPSDIFSKSKGLLYECQSTWCSAPMTLVSMMTNFADFSGAEEASQAMKAHDISLLVGSYASGKKYTGEFQAVVHADGSVTVVPWASQASGQGGKRIWNPFSMAGTCVAQGYFSKPQRTPVHAWERIAVVEGE